MRPWGFESPLRHQIKQRVTAVFVTLLFVQKESLAIRDKALGNDHPDVAISINNLAQIYNFWGHYAEAEPLYKRPLEIDEKALAPDHPHVAIVLENYADLLWKTQRNAEAEEMEARAEAIRAKHSGDDQPDDDNLPF